MGFKWPWEGDGVSDEMSRIHKAGDEAKQAILNAMQQSKDLSKTGPGQAQLNQVLNPLLNQRQLLDREMGRYSGLGDLLQGLATQSSLGSTANAQIASVNAARMSGMGRFGSGGMAAASARRGAVDAAAMQSASLANALLQSKVQAVGIDSNYRGAMLQQRGAVQGNISSVQQGYMGMLEERARMPISYPAELATVLLGIAGIEKGIATQKLANASAERTMFVGKAMDMGSDALAAFAGGA